MAFSSRSVLIACARTAMVVVACCPASVFALRVARGSTVQILRGENAGRSVTYTNVVRAIDKLGDWIGQTATFDVSRHAEAHSWH